MAISEEVRKKHIPTIGIECHVQLKTKTKLFSAVGNDAREAAPNTLISHIDTAMPGALPVLNEKAVELAIRAAYVLNTMPQKHSYFERKHYFYPDSPAGYQISQLHAPIIIGGSVDIEVGSETRSIKINRVQLEADAGKNTHPAGADYSLVDLNRAGTPLLEIVSEPDIHSAVEAKAYARELYLLVKYAGISEADLYHGNIRFDVNVSVSEDSARPGIRTEVKNLNSFRSVENAVLYEIDRQIEILESGEEVVQETRGWDEDKQKTTSQRSKEEAHDYRYMPEPDIPPIELSDEFIAKVKTEVPILPTKLREELSELNLNPSVIEDIIVRPEVAQLVVRLKEKQEPEAARRGAFWSLHNFSRVNEDDAPESQELETIDTDRIIQLSKMVDEGLLNSNAAQTVYDHLKESKKGAREVAESLNLLQVSDEDQIEKIVREVIVENSKAAEDIKNGEMKAIGFLVGEVMKKSGGKANPALAQQIIKKQLGID